jgi:hypothetical protein
MNFLSLKVYPASSRIKKYKFMSEVTEEHICNPSYLGG